MPRHKLELVLRYHHPQTSAKNSDFTAFLAAAKLPYVFNDKTVRPCEPVSVNCPSEPEKLRPLFRSTQINEAIEATKLQPLPQDRMEQQKVSKEACKLCLNAAISQELISYIKNANYWLDGKPEW